MVIDTLVVQLGLDPKQFTQGQKDALAALRRFQEESERDAKISEKRHKDSLGFLTELKRQALTVAGLLLGGRGIKDFVGYVTNLDAQSGRLSKTLNMSAKEIQAWGGAIESLGGSKDSATGALQGLSTAMHSSLLTGQIPGFARFVDMFEVGEDGVRRLKDAGKTLMDLGDYVSRFKPADAAAFLQSVVPGITPDMINFLVKSHDERVKLLDVQRSLNNVTKEGTENAERFQESLGKLTTSMTSLGRSMSNPLLPGTTSFIDKLSSGIKAVADASLPDWAKDYFKSMTNDKGTSATSFDELATEETLGEIDKQKNAWRAWFREKWTTFRKQGEAEGARLAEQERQSSDAASPSVNKIDTAPQHADELPPEARRLLDSIASGESAGAYDAIYGTKEKITNFASHPNLAMPITSGPNTGKTSSAAGRYQMLKSSWDRAAKALGLTDFSPANQDRAAWWLAQQRYKRETGDSKADLLGALRSNDPDTIRAAVKALAREWTSLPGGVEPNKMTQGFENRMGIAPATPGPGAGIPSSTDNSRKTSNNVTNTVNIGKVDVATQATDAEGVAQGLPGAVKQANWAAAFDNSLNG